MQKVRKKKVEVEVKELVRRTAPNISFFHDVLFPNMYTSILDIAYLAYHIL